MNGEDGCGSFSLNFRVNVCNCGFCGAAAMVRLLSRLLQKWWDI